MIKIFRRRNRHIHSQMKFFSGIKFKKKWENAKWKYARENRMSDKGIF